MNLARAIPLRWDQKGVGRAAQKQGGLPRNRESKRGTMLSDPCFRNLERASNL